jgi:PilZ domain
MSRPRTDPAAPLLTQIGSRHARKQAHCDVLMIHGAESWSSHLEDISATGVRIARPAGWKGCPGDLYSLDLMFKDDLHIHLDATVARISKAFLGFAFARIPEDKEIPLWNLLGGYADTLEDFKD